MIYFKYNKYTKWYFHIIENANKRVNKNFDGEIHHIIPKK